MIKTTILTVTILFAATMMVQEVYAPEQTADFNISGTGEVGKAIPDWVKTQFEWYVNEEIDEKTLLTSMSWLVDNRVMFLSEKAALEEQAMRNEISDLKQEVTELGAIVEHQLGIEISDTASGVDPIFSPTDKLTSGEIYTDEYGRIKVQFPWDRVDKEDVARFTAEIYAEKVARTQSSNTVWIPMIEDEVLVSFENGDPDRPIITGRVYHSENMPPYELPDGKMITGIKSTADGSMILAGPSEGTSDTSGTNYGVYGKATGSSDRPTEEVAFYYNKISFATDTVDDIMTKGGTTSAWEDGLDSFAEQGMNASVIYELQGIVVLCNTEIDKKTQTIDAELKIVEQWLDIIAEKQAITSTTTSDRLGTATTEEYTVDYNESDLNFITRILESSDQKIKSLQTGLTVLEQKLQTVGDDAQLANIDLQNQLQKMQQKLQMMSNLSKLQHDTAMSIIRNMSG